MSRRAPAANPLRIGFAGFELDEANALLLHQGRPVALAPTPFNLLCALARQPGALLSKEALLDSVWGHQFVTESVLKTAISDLRIALGDNPREPRIIETVPRRGYRFIAAPAAAAAAPAAGPAAPRSPAFIGRAEPMSRLHTAWQRASQGQRAVVWVTGEPGIGKSTVIENFVAALGDVRWARGQCVEHHGEGEPYLPVLEALAELCRKDPALPSLLRAVAPTWMLQLPWLCSADERDALRRELAGVGPERMLREMGELLERCTAERALLLVTEDLHWSDRATVQLIDHVARRRGPARLMWLASFRVAEVVAMEHPLNPLRRELRLHRLCEELALDPFAESEVAAYLAQRSPALARDEGFVRALHERTDGVPLFLSSVVSELMEPDESGVGGERGAQARLASLAVPENLAAIIDHQIARLDAEQRRLLAVAAVCGVEFRVETLALALGRDSAAVALACDELVRGHVWLAAPRSGQAADPLAQPHTFRHGLLRQVLYERTPPSARVHFHRDVGAALERERAAGLPVPAAELALHFDRGRQPMAALRHYAEAAGATSLHVSPTACMTLAERGLALVAQAPAGAERDDLELTLATTLGLLAFQSLGVGPQTKAALERAYALLSRAPAHPMRVRLLHGLGYACSLRGEYAEALVIAKRAEVLSTEQQDPGLMLMACFLHGEAHHMQGRTRDARAWMERGLAIAQEHASEAIAGEIFAADPQVILMGLLAIDLVRSGLVRQGLALGQRARERAAVLRQPMTRLVAAWQEALLQVRLGGAPQVAALADEMQALVDEHALAHAAMACRWFRGWAQAHMGRPLEGARLIQQAHSENVRLGMRSGASEVHAYAVEALLLAGEVQSAQTELERALQIVDELGERMVLPQLLLLQAAIARAGGAPEAGLAAARRAAEEARAQEAPWLELMALVELCENHPAAWPERRDLAALVERLPEAADTALMNRARVL